MWKTKQRPIIWKCSIFIPVPKKGVAKECSNYRTIAVISCKQSHAQGHPNMGGPMQRMTPPRGMVPLGPQSDPWLSLQNYGGAMRPPLNALGGPGMPGMNMGPGGGRPWPNPTNANSGKSSLGLILSFRYHTLLRRLGIT
ncbi:Single-stranded DNA-binding protein 2 [Varanus komodoensis]|nr:Single-stranded DNA-binding protein 2 [Varanus komodoensis]